MRRATSGTFEQVLTVTFRTCNEAGIGTEPSLMTGRAAVGASHSKNVVAWIAWKIPSSLYLYMIRYGHSGDKVNV